MWFDAQRNVVVYDTPRAEEIASSVPGSVRLHNGYVAAPATLYNLQLLRYLGFETIQPMDVSYDWPGRYVPFQAQRVTANFLSVHPRAFVLNDMGTGKTLAALWAADFVMRCNVGVRCLVVAPLSTLERVWSDAIFQNFLGRRRGVVLHGSAARRRELLAEPADFYIINYDGLEVLERDLAARTDIRMAIVDEASAYRNRTTQRHRLARKLLAPMDYLWMMSGTPIPNGPTDAYGLAKLVNNCFGEGWGSFHDRTMVKISNFKWVPKSGAHEAAYKLMQPAVRFAITDCIDLPPNTIAHYDVELSDTQKKAYNQLKKECQMVMASGKVVTAANEAVLRGKILQVCAGAVYGENREVHKVDCAPRLKVLRELLEQCPRKVIIFAHLTNVLNMLYRELKNDYSCVMVRGNSDGGPSKKDNDEALRAFQQDKHPRIILANPQSIAHGVDLFEAALTVWWMPTDKNELFRQGNKRMDRPGQKFPNTTACLAGSPVEREIYKRLENSEGMQGLVLAMARGQL